jgi:DNA-binding NarL/FixJ family response regulator
MNQVKILIVDDHKIVRLGIKSYLVGNDNFIVCGEAENAENIIKTTKENAPDIILMDIVMPGLSGIEATKKLKKEYPDIKVLILTSNTDQNSIIESVEAGADGFLSKEASKDEFINALNHISKGEKYFGKTSISIVNAYLNKSENADKLKSKLSTREVEIVSLFCAGLSYKEIADKLFLSPRTVETHKINILAKLDLKTTVDIVKYAIKNNIIYI